MVATNATLDKVGCLLAAQSGHDGLARALEPAHSTVDGDAIVAAAVGGVTAPLDQVRLLAARVVEEAPSAAVGPADARVKPALPTLSGRRRERHFPQKPHVRSSVVSTLAAVREEALQCERCPLARGRTTVVFGEGDANADLMVVGEGPGHDEDLQGRPFVGRSGKLLDRLLVEEIGMRRESVYIANVVKCRPPGNRDPLPAEIDACRPWLEAQVELIRPQVVLTLGNFSTKLLLQTTDGIRLTRGRVYPWGSTGAVLVPTYHPAAALRGGGEVLAEMRADFVRAKEALSGGRR